MGRHRTSAAQWRVLAIVFVMLNFAMGINFTGYGALVGAIEAEFHTTRTLAAGGISMLTLALGVLSPVVGTMMPRVPLKWLMAAGILTNAAGYVVISQVHDIRLMLAAYALLIGPGFCLFSVVPCTAIITEWFDEGRGRALGLVNMPLGNAVLPVAAAAMLGAAGLRWTFLSFALLLMALLPPLLLLPDKPQARAADRVGAEAAPSLPAMSAMQILRTPAFLVLTLGVSVVSAGGLVMVTHIVSLGTGRGLSLSIASLLLAGFGLAGLVGAPAFGWISDKVGTRLAFAGLCFASVVPWLALGAVGGSFPVLLALALLIGALCNGTIPLFGLGMGEWLGEENVGLAMGLSYFLQIPFLFGAGPLAGAMFDGTGSYSATTMLHAGSFAVMGMVFLLFRPAAAGRAREAMPATL